MRASLSGVFFGLALLSACGSDLPSGPTPPRALEAPSHYRISFTYPLPTTGLERDHLLHLHVDEASETELVGAVHAPWDKFFHDFEAKWNGSAFPVIWEKGTTWLRANVGPRGETCSGTIKVQTIPDEIPWTNCTVELVSVYDPEESGAP